MRIGSLFSGYGGLDMGVRAAVGGDVAWVCEVDANPAAILKHHHPDVPNLGDITKVQWADVEPVDILTAGYPCQPFSHAGQRLGTDDARHLWPYVVEALSTLRPRFAVFENVQGHLSLGFDQVLRDLNTLGYTAAWVLISAASVGAPHRRNRLFILAEDTHGQLRSRTDRRGGVHRDSGSWRLLPGETQGLNVGQGYAGAAPNGADLRREDRPRQGRDGSAPRIMDVAPDRSGGIAGDPTDTALAHSEGGACGHRPRVPVDGGRLAETAERTSVMDRGDEAASFGAPRTHSGGESAWPGPGAASPAGPDARGGVPVGSLVGAGGRPVRAGGVHGPSASEWPDGGGSRLLDPRDGAIDVPLLPTPAVNDMGASYTPETWDAWTERMKQAHGNGNGRGASLSIEALRMLPTPTAGNPADGADLDGWEEARQALIGKGYNGNGRGTPLAITVRQADFGDYAPAIRRWETVLGRPAPNPTEPTGKNGAHRLSPAFVEWLMGLPTGHVTAVPGLTRNAQLKALGNGVVPQQATTAIRHLLTIQEAAA